MLSTILIEYWLYLLIPKLLYLTLVITILDCNYSYLSILHFYDIFVIIFVIKFNLFLLFVDKWTMNQQKISSWKVIVDKAGKSESHTQKSHKN